ncbi:CoA binding domain-containing protein [Pseudomassariella vexata]|uniref:CoA binding domain-domain-containing protein n=1 Tax=Pseudomassariella vexata TaxID=1141098 RepID=A0A1Y2DZW6_9PEZI|nr:CoA binding domain-containing protein [Pseudomassariella vexata]ORY64830.1 CoA binding domain-domain-containing protein [Pseudomassariella vexata]
MTTEATVKKFFSSPHFAVVGASSNPAKFGHKIFAWYIHHAIPATPINPVTPSIAVNSSTYSTVASLSALPNPKETSVSIITPPAATLKVLQEAKELGVPAVWMQPGSFDEAVMKFAQDEYEGEVVAGDGGRGSEGWCILVDGDKGLKAVGKL